MVCAHNTSADAKVAKAAVKVALQALASTHPVVSM